VTFARRRPIICVSQTNTCSNIDGELLNMKRESILGMAMTGVRHLLSVSRQQASITVETNEHPRFSRLTICHTRDHYVHRDSMMRYIDLIVMPSFGIAFDCSAHFVFTRRIAERRNETRRERTCAATRSTSLIRFI
jgi:hypothetical protein